MPYLEELRKRQILKTEPVYMAAYMPNMAM